MIRRLVGAEALLLRILVRHSLAPPPDRADRQGRAVDPTCSEEAPRLVEVLAVEHLHGRALGRARTPDRSNGRGARG